MLHGFMRRTAQLNIGDSVEVLARIFLCFMIYHMFGDCDRGGPSIFYRYLGGQRVSEDTFAVVSGYLID